MATEANPARPAAGAAIAADDSGLIRGLGRWAMVAVMVNAIVGAGIFGLPSKVHALVGAWGLVAMAACALVIGCIALCFAEVSSRFTTTGGPYLYVERAFGPLAGFLVGWLIWISRVAGIAAIGSVMTSYLAFFWAPAGAGWGRGVAVTLAIGALTAINWVGVRRAGGAIQALTIGKVAPLLLFAGVGMFFLAPQRLALPRIPDPGSFSKAVLQLIFAFAGFEAAVITAGEMKNPRRDLPFALMISLALTTLLYFTIQLACIGTLPGLGASERPLADASVRFMGSGGAALIAFGALVSTLGTMCGSLLLSPRILFAMSERGQLPRVLARLHPRFHTPHPAILLTGLAALPLSLSGKFTYVVSLSVIARLATYIATAAALVVFRRRASDPPPLFRVPGGGWVVTATLVACVWLLTQSGTRELRDVAIAVALGLGIYAAHRASRARGGSRDADPNRGE